VNYCVAYLMIWSLFGVVFVLCMFCRVPPRAAIVVKAISMGGLARGAVCVCMGTCELVGFPKDTYERRQGKPIQRRLASVNAVA
jgi:hypothetical protein